MKTQKRRGEKDRLCFLVVDYVGLKNASLDGRDINDKISGGREIIGY